MRRTMQSRPLCNNQVKKRSTKSSFYTRLAHTKIARNLLTWGKSQNLLSDVFKKEKKFLSYDDLSIIRRLLKNFP